MKIRYEFADGTVSEVELEECIGTVIIEDRRLKDSLSRRERYHCDSLDAAQFGGMEYSDEETPETRMEHEIKRVYKSPYREGHENSRLSEMEEMGMEYT